MNQNLKEDLLRDELLQAVTIRRKKRLAGLALGGLIPIALMGAFLRSGDIKPEPVLVSEVLKEDLKIEKPPVKVLNSQDELLAHLAHLGPVIVTQDDGSRVLYLTNRKGSSSLEPIRIQLSEERLKNGHGRSVKAR